MHRKFYLHVQPGSPLIDEVSAVVKPITIFTKDWDAPRRKRNNEPPNICSSSWASRWTTSDAAQIGRETLSRRIPDAIFERYTQTTHIRRYFYRNRNLHGRRYPGSARCRIRDDPLDRTQYRSVPRCMRYIQGQSQSHDMARRFDRRFTANL